MGSMGRLRPESLASRAVLQPQHGRGHPRSGAARCGARRARRGVPRALQPAVAMHCVVLLFASLFPFAAVAQQATPAPAAAPVSVGTGAHTYTWVANWGRLGDGKELGNTHGCLCVDK